MASGRFQKLASEPHLVSGSLPDTDETRFSRMGDADVMHLLELQRTKELQPIPTPHKKLNKMHIRPIPLVPADPRKKQHPWSFLPQA